MTKKRERHAGYLSTSPYKGRITVDTVTNKKFRFTHDGQIDNKVGVVSEYVVDSRPNCDL